MMTLSSDNYHTKKRASMSITAKYQRGGPKRIHDSPKNLKVPRFPISRTGLQEQLFALLECNERRVCDFVKSTGRLFRQFGQGGGGAYPPVPIFYAVRGCGTGSCSKQFLGGCGLL